MFDGQSANHHQLIYNSKDIGVHQFFSKKKKKEYLSSDRQELLGRLNYVPHGPCLDSRGLLLVKVHGCICMRSACAWAAAAERLLRGDRIAMKCRSLPGLVAAACRVRACTRGRAVRRRRLVAGLLPCWRRKHGCPMPQPKSKMRHQFRTEFSREIWGQWWIYLAMIGSDLWNFALNVKNRFNLWLKPGAVARGRF
jgi:hypothetical protein